MDDKNERIRLAKRPAAGAGTFPVGLLRYPKSKLQPQRPARGSGRPSSETVGENSQRCPRCGFCDIRPILTLQSVAWWACFDCFHRWYAQRKDPAKLVNRGGFPGLPRRVIGSPKPEIKPGSRHGRRRLPQQVLKAPMMSMRF